MNEFIKTAIDLVGSQKRLGELCGVSQQAVHKWLRGKSITPPISCSIIERATNGMVTRKDLRPNDWQRIWPELVQGAQESK